MKRYEAYKDSGIEWIGQIPQGWAIMPLKYCLSLKGRIGWNGLKSEEFEKESYAYLVTGQDFHSDVVDWSKCYQINKERYDEDPFIQLENGDLLVTKDGTIGKVAKVSNLDKPACLNSGIFVVKQTKGLFVQDYLYWLLVSNQLKEFVGYYSTGATIAHLYQNVFENMPLIVPSKQEQHFIASYLNKKVGQIDSSISAINTQIDELKSYRQSITFEAVTKGLNLEAPMHDSGIDWSGEKPIHWNVCRIKDLVNLQSGTNLTSSDITDCGEYPVYGGNGIRGYYHQYLNDGDYILIGRQGALCGNVNYASGKFWATEHAVICYPKCLFARKWLGETLRAMNLGQYSLSAAQPGLAVERIKMLKLPLPPLEEQKAIASYLDNRTNEIDTAIMTLENQRDDLNALKQSVISEAVTGQIDVRNFNNN